MPGFRRTLLLVPVLLGLFACEQAPVEEAGPDLDAALVEALTLNGQVQLSNFTLPDPGDLAAIPQDPANPLTADKVELGMLLFHETALALSPRHASGRGTYSCATCHHAAAGFQAGRRQGLGDGGSGWGVRGEGRTRNPLYAETELDVQPLHSPSVLNVAYQSVMVWSGAFGAHGPNEGTEAHWAADTSFAVNALGYAGVEAQAIAGLTKHRMDSLQASVLATHPAYLERWQRVFPGEAAGAIPAGLAIAAYERTLLAGKAPFQRWLRGEAGAMTTAEKRGALVFFGKAGCETCHTGPALNQTAFYALGMPDLAGTDVFGDVPESLGRGGFLGDPAEAFKFKVPQLYNLKDSPFYGHGGTFQSVHEVVEYYNEGRPDRTLPNGILERRFKPLGLTPDEIDDLTAFLTDALHDPDLMRYVPASLPSGNCFPANDPAARRDLGCE